MLDNYNREINYLRLSVTDLCNLKCKYCMPYGVEKCSHDDILRLEQLAIIVKALTTLGIEKVRITGGEPLVRRGIVNLIKQISPLVKNVSLTTNGTLLAPVCKDLKEAGLNSINIGIDTLEPDVYKELTLGGNINDAIGGIKEAYNFGFKLKINAVLQKGINEDKLPSLLDFAKQNGANLRFVELMPFDQTKDYFEKHYVSALNIIKRYNLKFAWRENNCSYYHYGDEIIGLITPISDKFCSSCNRIRVTAKGLLLPCLNYKIEYDLKPYLNDFDKLVSYLANCIKAKPKQHNLDNGQWQKNMFGIGG
ncbi:MAG: GTP 3',8-cyclase MoaA [Clostridiales bacterium]|nr:GTP 3',8-cyclase MoaA [Clostridiales bacterium]